MIQAGLITCKNHANADIGFTGIGNNAIIQARNQQSLPINPQRTFKDYIAFYFGKRSIMLYNIITGYGEVNQMPQSEIIYLIYDISQIINHQYEYFFTDGHALQYPTTKFFTDLNDLGEIDYHAAYATDFSAAAEINNPGLKRRKQAEFHIYYEMNLYHISEIVVFNNAIQSTVQTLLNNGGYNINVRVDNSFYFI